MHTDQKQKAEIPYPTSRAKILVLPNAWDAASAVILEQSGFPAIATTSAGIAFSLGYPDKQRISREEAFAVVARIVHSVKIPVTPMSNPATETAPKMPPPPRGRPWTGPAPPPGGRTGCRPAPGTPP